MHEKIFSGIIGLMFSHNENELIAIGQKIGRLLQARDVLIYRAIWGLVKQP